MLREQSKGMFASECVRILCEEKLSAANVFAGRFAVAYTCVREMMNCGDLCV